MATFVGQTGSTFHYAGTLISAFGYRALHVEVRVYQQGEPYTIVTDLGRARSNDHAVDMVAAIVKRKRDLFDLLAGGK